MKSVAFTLCLLLAVCIAAAQQQVAKKVPEMEQRCLDCICQASSNCDETLKCHNAGGNSYFCGPYVVSWAYWHDGGRPGDKGRPHDFETCLNNKTCAEKAVRGYMRRYGQDCDGNGVIDCDDFSRIHKLGYGSCGDNSILNTDYFQKYDICYSGYEPGNEAGHNYDYGEGNIEARRGGHQDYN